MLLATAPAAASRIWQFDYAGGYVRTDTPTPDFVWGNLTASGGKGGMSWKGEAASDDDYGVAPPPSGPTDAATDTLRTYTGRQVYQAPLQPDLEFTSAPLPRDIHLNASKPVQLDLFVKNSPKGTAACNNGNAYVGIAAKVTVGERIIAGNIGNTYFSPYTEAGQYNPAIYPVNPPGYSLCPFRMAPETDFLASGAVIKVTLKFYNPPWSIQIGLKDEHRTVLRLPGYSVYEAALRSPLLAGSDPSGVGDISTSSESSASAVSGLGAFVVGLALPWRSRARTALAVLLVATMGMAGCVSGGKTQATGTTGNAGEVHETVGGLGVEGTTIVGLVHDDLHIPVGGAHVSLLGTSFFSTTDGRGAFTLAALPAGKQTLRVDKTGFHSLERPITLEAGRITRVDVLLIPTSIKESDFRPHHHDYWGGKDSLTLIERDLGPDCTGSYGCQPASIFQVPAAKPGESPIMILPGTYNVDVTLTYDPAKMGRQHFGLKVDANGDPPSPYTSNISHYYPRESGQTFHVAANWEMADVGHQFFSTWKFSIYPMGGEASTKPEDTAYYYAEAYSRGYVGYDVTSAIPEEVPSFKIKVTITKGVLPLEPAHPVFFTKGPVYEVNKGTGSIYGGGQTMVIYDGLYHGCFEATGGPTYNFLSYGFGAPKKIIPPGTKWIEVKLNAGRDPTPKFDWVLRYKDGSSAPITYWTPTTPGFQESTATLSAGSATFKIKVDDTITDNMYAQKSSWYFGVVPSDMDSACLDYQTAGAAMPLGGEVWHFDITIKVHNDPM